MLFWNHLAVAGFLLCFFDSMLFAQYKHGVVPPGGLGAQAAPARRANESYDTAIIARSTAEQHNMLNHPANRMYGHDFQCGQVIARYTIGGTGGNTASDALPTMEEPVAEAEQSAHKTKSIKLRLSQGSRAPLLR